MNISAFDKTNFKSKKVKDFIFRLLGFFIFYVVSLVFYFVIGNSGLSQTMGGDMEKAKILLTWSGAIFGFSIVALYFFWELKWQILRTIVTAASLLSIAYLLCAIVIMVSRYSFIHLVILITIGLIFFLIFFVTSNIRIYFRDKTYADVFIEMIISLIFLVFIISMIMSAYQGGNV